MNLLRTTLTCFLLSVITVNVLAYDKEAYVKEEYLASNGHSLKCRTLYPENYDPGKAYPVIIFLHGVGERGDDNERQLFLCWEGMIAQARKQEEQPIVVFPQCPAGDRWSHYDSRGPSVAVLAIKEMLDEWVETGKANPKQLHAAGLSMGGFGVFDMLVRFPDYFATVSPICGGLSPVSPLEKYDGKTAIRIYHGDIDDQVEVDYSRKAYAALLKANANVTYKEYVNVRHNSWDFAVAEPDFVSWMLANPKK